MRAVTLLVALSLAIASTTLVSAVFGTTLATGAIAALPKASLAATVPDPVVHLLADNSPMSPVQTDLPAK